MNGYEFFGRVFAYFGYFLVVTVVIGLIVSWMLSPSTQIDMTICPWVMWFVSDIVFLAIVIVFVLYGGGQ